MKRILFLLTLLCLNKALHAQYVYTIKADSVKITNSCDTAELIIENHTQNVCGFLFNKGRGRTEFRRGLIRINDSVSIIGCDTLKMNPWLQGGNRFGTIGKFGTLDDNPIDYYTNNSLRGRWATTGNFIIGSAIDEGYKFQVKGNGGISINPTLSRPGDRIMIGNNINSNDGQNILFRTSSDDGATYKNVLVERDGNIGMGIGAPYGWGVGSPTVRCHVNGQLSFMTEAISYGNTSGPYNSSALVTQVSNPNEWLNGDNPYPAGQNYYYFGTVLHGALNGNKRAPLWITGRELLFKTGAKDSTSLKISESRNVMVGTETDNGDKLQVIGDVYANGSKHRMGNLAIVSGQDALIAGSAVGIRIDHHTNGSFILQGTPQGWAKDMFVFTDCYGTGQNVYYEDQSIIKIKSGIKLNNAPGNSASMLNIQPDYNLDIANSSPLIMRGIYYKPTLTSIVPGSKHIAIETVTGDVLLGTTSGNTGIGTNAPTAQLHTTGAVRFGGLTNNNSLTRVVVADAIGNLYYREESSGSALNRTANSDQATLLNKIEELTLYITEQDKTIKKQSDQYAELKQEMAELKALIKRK